MNRKEAMKIICDGINDEIIISANGFISRDLFSTLDKDSNFYMIGSMGLASSIGLGIAIKNPRRRSYFYFKTCQNGFKNNENIKVRT